MSFGLGKKCFSFRTPSIFTIFCLLVKTVAGKRLFKLLVQVRNGSSSGGEDKVSLGLEHQLISRVRLEMSAKRPLKLSFPEESGAAMNGARL